MCGDKLVVGDEECDDGNSQPGDGCGPDCKIEQGWAVGHQGKCCHLIECGDGIPDSGEECDDGNQQSGDGCTHQCQVEWGFTCVLGPAGKSICKPVCGDGIRAGMERCDDGNTADGDGCSGACQHEPGWHCDQPVSGASKCVQTVCGDSVVMEPEQCDDGNLAPGDGCSDKCQVETGWRCQAAIALPHQIGQILQTVQGESSCDAICGDRVQVGKEECDDGNRRSADGCSSECLLESGWSCDNDGCHLTVCGDGNREGSEECDDENTDAGDGCDAACKIEDGWECGRVSCNAICGDGTVMGSEQCDDGNLSDGDGCSGVCEIEPSCGNSRVERNEECDPGERNGCDSDCKLVSGWDCPERGDCVAVCGDGIRATDMDGVTVEQCDDGNTVAKDGCSPTCALEKGWKCSVVETDDRKRLGSGGDECTPVCGDGLKAGSEACDDGNLVPNDGCDVKCVPEAGWDCSGSGECKPICGDGIRVLSVEECDDENMVDGDGCSRSCQLERGWSCKLSQGEGGDDCTPKCGDGVTVSLEQCDDGNLSDKDGCSSRCEIEPGWDCPQPFDQGASRCTKQCGNGHRANSEKCDDANQQAGDGCSPDCVVEAGWWCNGDSPDKCARIQDCQVGDWSEWSACSAECNGGHETRQRAMVVPASPGGSTCAALEDKRECSTQPCPKRDCSMTSWAEWSECTQQCGTGHKTHTRTMIEPAAHGGKPCGPLTEQVTCNTHPCNPARDCTVSPWTEWSPCTKKCGGGVQARARNVTQPAVATGSECPALDETRGCGTEGCPPVDCKMSEWSDWSECSKPCGAGESFRTRAIQTHPDPAGLGCGPDREKRTCSMQQCNQGRVDCVEAEWSDWGECSKECGGGSKSRQRAVVIAPEEGGASCGKLSETLECNTTPCAEVACLQSSWADWTDCSKQCGGGVQSRTRQVLVPPSSPKAIQCGQSSEDRNCNTQACA
eukprot:TRINITY_DN3109_c0_g1_i1.p1 TRINITY_DN3109_c0_g1~~TRINITY_DN3109_c0_g1_i1.p1  ORF type:complete len:956 (-),score=107.58 TRINITY_DN3109_c0_g1_i1:230-3097(-)